MSTSGYDPYNWISRLLEEPISNTPDQRFGCGHTEFYEIGENRLIENQDSQFNLPFDLHFLRPPNRPFHQPPTKPLGTNCLRPCPTADSRFQQPPPPRLVEQLPCNPIDAPPASFDAPGVHLIDVAVASARLGRFLAKPAENQVVKMIARAAIAGVAGLVSSGIAHSGDDRL
jgi:hypothetical protein